MHDELPTRREREKEQHRLEILDVALELFSAKGYHNVSMQEIAQKAEFSVGTLYSFFDNKETLYKALILDRAGRFHEAIVSLLTGPNEEIEKLRDYVRVKGQLFGTNLPFIRLFIAESGGATFNMKAGLDEDMRRQYAKTLEYLASVFESGIKKARFRGIAAPYSLAVALDSVINAFLLLSLEAPDVHPYPKNPDTILDIFFRGLAER